MQVFQSFFVSLNLPYSVVRGEELALQVTVFNYELEAQLVSLYFFVPRSRQINISSLSFVHLAENVPIFIIYYNKHCSLAFLVKVTITLKGSKHFAIIDEVNKLGLRGESTVNKDYVDKVMDLKVEITVGAGQGKAVSFPVVPRTLGFVPIEVRAQSSRNADAVKRSLLVEVHIY